MTKRRKQAYPAGWDEERIRKLAEHYDNQAEDEQVAEHEAAFLAEGQTVYQGERTIVHRRGKDSAAIISISDLRLLELLIEEAEDRLDVEAAEGPDGLSDADKRIHYEEFRRQQGLHDEPKPKKRHSTTAAGTKNAMKLCRNS